MKGAVLFLTNAYPDFESSSRGIFIKKMACHLQKEGYKITVLTPKIYKKSPLYESKNGLEVYRFPFLAGDRLLIEYARIPYLRMVLYYLSGSFFVFYLLLKNHFDFIHVHWAIPTGLIGMIAGAIFRIPVIVTIHGSDLRMANEGSPFLKKIFLLVCKRASHVSCVSMGQKREIEGLGVLRKEVSVVPMGIELDFREAGLKRKGSNGRLPVTVISNRNLLAIYNVEQLIRAIPLVLNGIQNVRFFIAGVGPERERLERKAKELKIASWVNFLGHIPNEKMADLLSQADIYVSTSLSDGTSVSLLEAMAAGVFPVVSDIPANREWIEDGKNGFLFPIHDEKTLAQKILMATQDRELRKRGGDLNRSIVEQKALWPVCIEKIREIYDLVMIPDNRK